MKQTAFAFVFVLAGIAVGMLLHAPARAEAAVEPVCQPVGNAATKQGSAALAAVIKDQRAGGRATTQFDAYAGVVCSW